MSGQRTRGLSAFSQPLCLFLGSNPPVSRLQRRRAQYRGLSQYKSHKAVDELLYADYINRMGSLLLRVSG